MNHEYDQQRKHSPSAATNHNDAVEPGQSSRSHLLHKPEQPIASGLVQRKARELVEAACELPVQQAKGTGGDEAAVHTAAARGVATTSSPLPHAETIQRAFGRHDISGIMAHTGPAAVASAQAMGADAYATGNHVVLGGGTDLHTVAHEAAHVVQQRGGVQLKGGVGAAGDVYEQHADAVADAVVAGKSAESLLSNYAGSSGGSHATQPSIQRYSKINGARVSDHQHLVVVDGAPHNEAYATATKITEGAQRLAQHESHVTLTAGAALTPADVGLTDDQVQAGLQRVEPRLAIPATDTQADTDQQNDNSIVTAELYEAIANNVIASLPADPVVADEVTLIDDMENGTAKESVTRLYGLLNGDYNPANIARRAQAVGLAPRYVRLIMQKIIAYQQQIKTELRGGGFTTPKDCGQVARKFVRGADVRYHALTAEERQQRGYSGHYFGMVLEDGTDKVSLENAVGGSKYEQLWKAASFDASWHFEMRGTTVDDADTGNEEMHGTGTSKQDLVQDPDSAQRDLNTVRDSGQQAIRRADAELTEPSTATGKNSYTELTALAPATPADYERERVLLMDGLAYANDHLNSNKKGRRRRVTRWLAAAQAVIDRDGRGPNVQLAAHVLEQMRKVGKH
jgi:hypothetical protein